MNPMDIAIHKIDPLSTYDYEHEVVAINGKMDAQVGYLVSDTDDGEGVVCDGGSDASLLLNVTHYILVSDIVAQIKESEVSIG